MWGNPVFIAGSFSLIARSSGLTSKIIIVDLVSVFLCAVMAQPLMWLMLIAIAMGKFLMNRYEIVNVQPIHRNGEQVRENILSPVSTVRDDLLPLIF